MAEQRTKVMVVDDDPTFLRLLSKVLSAEAYDVECVDSGSAALEHVMASRPHFIVTDWEMPDMDGIQLCRKVRELELPNYVYIIVVTARHSVDHVIQAIEAGADDFITKPVTREELLSRMLAGGRVLSHDFHLTRIAYTDTLTDLPTRRLFSEQANVELQRARRYRRAVSCVIFDIDFFKRINDAYGHPAGDAVLKSIADLLRRHSRETDINCRFGGEEFCAVLPETSEPQARTWAERLRREIRQSRTTVGDKDLSVTASFGVAEWVADVESVDELIELADQCLLAAKDAGRDRVVCFRDLNSGHYLDGDRQDASQCLFQSVVARDVMTSIVGTLRKDATIADAAQYFLQFRISSAPVVNQTGQLVGIVSEKDLIGILRNRDGVLKTIGAAMRTNVVCYDVDIPMETIYNFLCRVAIRNVIVVDDGRPVGFIGRNSILRWFVNRIALLPADDQTYQAIAGPDAKRTKKAQLQAAVVLLKSLSNELYKDIAVDEWEDIGPNVIGTVSRIQEVLNDLLASSGYITRSEFGALV